MSDEKKKAYRVFQCDGAVLPVDSFKEAAELMVIHARGCEFVVEHVEISEERVEPSEAFRCRLPRDHEGKIREVKRKVLGSKRFAVKAVEVKEKPKAD